MHMSGLLPRMAVVALLRGANVGGKRFKTKDVLDALAGLDAVNLGAAGTFVVRKKVAESTLRKRIAAALPFECDILVLSAAEVHAALTAGAKHDVPADAVRRFATVMDKEVKAKLPLEEPSGAGWGVRVLAVEGRVALGVRKRVDVTGVYPNAVVEKAFEVRATTRDWPTMEKIGKLLD